MAEIRIHVLTDEFTTSHLRMMKCSGEEKKKFQKTHEIDLYELCRKTPSVLVCDNDHPFAGWMSRDFVESFPYGAALAIDDAMIKMADTEVSLGNISPDVVKFLMSHAGKKAFCVGW